MVAAVEIAGRRVGAGAPCLVIAEAGVNHNGDLDQAQRLVDAAADAGADAVKFQTFSAARLATADAPVAGYQRSAVRNGASQRDLLAGLELSRSAHEALMRRATARGLLFLSTPFDEECADLLAGLGVPAFKIASGELTNLPFLAHVARYGKPLIVSTGMATLVEVQQAVRTIRRAGNDAVVLLHCVSQYPAEPGVVNLRAMECMAAAFHVPVGFSDHTTGAEVALAAVARGACVVEKHVTLDRTLPGPDHQASVEPDDLAALVRGIRRVEASLGHGRKEPAEGEAAVAAVVRKSLVAARALPVGTVLRAGDVVLKRPGTGIPPRDLGRVVGRRTRRALLENELVSWADLR